MTDERSMGRCLEFLRKTGGAVFKLIRLFSAFCAFCTRMNDDQANSLRKNIVNLLNFNVYTRFLQTFCTLQAAAFLSATSSHPLPHQFQSSVGLNYSYRGNFLSGSPDLHQFMFHFVWRGLKVQTECHCGADY